MPKIVQFTEEERSKIVALYSKSGLTVADIARHLKCSGSPVLRVLRDKEVPMRAPGDELKASRNNKIMDLHDQGWTNAEIAESLNISRQRVHQIITRGY